MPRRGNRDIEGPGKPEQTDYAGFSSPERTRADGGVVPTPRRGTPTLRKSTKDDLKRFQRATKRDGPILVIVHGSGIGRQLTLHEGAFSIGRADECDLRLDDDMVSRCHCDVELTRDKVVVSDRNSRNGTYVNDEAIRVALLKEGDTLRIGGSLVRLLWGSNPEAAYYDEIYRITITDALTETLNRRGLDAELERHWYDLRRHQRVFSVAMFDVDHFKAINDTHGHRIGDLVLAKLGSMCLESKRYSDAVGRFGGDEFVFLCAESPLGPAAAVAERLRQRVSEESFGFDTVSFRVTISVGVAEATAGLASVEELIAAADQRLYEAKQAGRNRVVAR